MTVTQPRGDATDRAEIENPVTEAELHHPVEDSPISVSRAHRGVNHPRLPGEQGREARVPQVAPEPVTQGSAVALGHPYRMVHGRHAHDGPVTDGNSAQDYNARAEPYIVPEYHGPGENFGLYWHFVDIIWIFLFPLLYLGGRSS